MITMIHFNSVSDGEPVQCWLSLLRSKLLGGKQGESLVSFLDCATATGLCIDLFSFKRNS